MIENDQASKSAIKQVSEINFSAILETRNRLLDENSAASRWIMATLITLNAGGMFGVGSFGQLASSAKIVSISMFCSGIFFAVMVGYTTILAAQSLSKPINDLADAWMTAMLTESVDIDAILPLQNAVLKKSKPWKIFSHCSGWLSLSLFFSAVMYAAFNIR